MCTHTRLTSPYLSPAIVLSGSPDASFLFENSTFANLNHQGAALERAMDPMSKEVDEWFTLNTSNESISLCLEFELRSETWACNITTDSYMTQCISLYTHGPATTQNVKASHARKYHTLMCINVTLSIAVGVWGVQAAAGRSHEQSQGR